MTAGIKTRDEARADLGLAPDGKDTGLGKFNPYHDEQGRFTTADGAVDPASRAVPHPSAGVQVAENDYDTTMADAGGADVGTVIAQIPTVPPFEAPPPEPVKPMEVNPAAPESANPSNAPTTAGSAPAAGLVDPALVNQLVASGVKITPENVVATAVTPDGRIVWLETGNAKSGLQHIIGEHGQEFADISVGEADIPRVVMNALTNGTIVGYQGQGTDRPIIETTIDGGKYRIAITIGSNGYVVGANMRGRVR